jgi:hypothetical protein
MEARTGTNNVTTVIPLTPVSDNGRAHGTGASAAVTAPAPNLETEFIRQVRARFLDASGNSLWPKITPGSNLLKEEIAAFELPDAVSAMFDSVERKTPFPDGMPDTAISLIKAAARATDWPATTNVPEDWKDAAQLFHEFEIGVVTNIMLKAFNRSGQGGTPREWPPSNP